MPGLIPLWLQPASLKTESFTEAELRSLIERDVSHWLAHRVGDGSAIVLAPPNLTASMYFHGGFRGVGTLSWENQPGLAAAIRIACATSEDEAQELLSQRSITHVVIPSWDRTLDDFAILGRRRESTAELPQDTFVAALHHWALPPWLRPVPYRVPAIPGLEGQTVAVFEVVEESDPAVVAARVVAYFLEMEWIERAAALRGVLQRHSKDLGALTALAQIEFAVRDSAAFAAAVEKMRPYLSPRIERRLPFDRRVHLAIILTQAGQSDNASAVVGRCLDDLNEPRLRSLSVAELIRFQKMLKLTNREISDERLRELAVSLVPPNLRGNLD